MYVSKEMLLAQLPADRNEWVVIAADQRVKDIISELLDAYPEFAKYYDRIGTLFEGSNIRETCDNLYDFCKRELEYREEPEEWQTSALPAGLLTRGYCDCKGYASFIGGCLGAISRVTGEDIDWSFCFASYKIDQPTPYHVFIVVNTDDGPIWIDPTPGANDKEPIYALMAQPGEPRPTAQVNGAGQLEYVRGTVGKNTSAPTTITAVATAATSLLSGNIASAVMSVLPLIETWLSGYTYTGGDYALGEIFLNRVTDKATSSRWDTPDTVVPIAWMYFSTLFGIPVAVNTDLDTIESGSLDAYLQGRPEQRGYVTQAQVTRAKQLLDTLGHRTQEDPQWPPESFGLMPYVGPIPDPRIPGALFTGQLPNGQQVQNGYPVTAATAGGNAQIPGAVDVGTPDTTVGGLSVGTLLLIGAGILVLWYIVEND